MDASMSGALTHRIHLKPHDSVRLCYVVREEQHELYSSLYFNL